MTWAGRLLELYTKTVIRHPWAVIILICLGVGYLGYHIKDFELEASPDALVAEKSAELRYYRQLQFRYGGPSDDFFFITFTPASGDLLSRQNLTVIDRLRQDIERVEYVSSVLCILDIPLLKNPPGDLGDLADNIKTLQDPDVNMELARRELKNSPLYQELIVSKNLETTALRIEFVENDKARRLLKKRTELREEKYTEGLTEEEKAQLEEVSTAYEETMDEVRRKRHRALEKIRHIVDEYRSEGTIYAGGASMLADDLISYIKRDIQVFGIGMFLFLVATLWVIFRRKRWVALPIGCCILSVVAMMGLLGIVGWRVTIVSSNFISLQLIMTMALAIHLVVRYTEVLADNPDAEKWYLTRETVRTIFTPCLYTVLTTIAGFSSLVFSGLLPVINFGWMMTMGLAVSLTITFLFFPAAVTILRKTTVHQGHARYVKVTDVLARFTEKRRAIIFGISGLLVAVIVLGTYHLNVENSFVNYFAKSTEVYKGMKFIDRHLGGTTPLHVVINFDEENAGDDAEQNLSPDKSGPPESEPPADGAFGDFSEFEESSSEDEVYWYTQEKIGTIRKAHDYLDGLNATGKVLSIETLLKIARDLQDQDQLDNFDLALLFKKFPERFQDTAVKPFVSKEDNQIRMLLRIKDTLPNLDRHQLLAQIREGLRNEVGLDKSQYRLAGPMVLYSNTLQSLYKSQVQTAGFTIVALMAMIFVLFRSFKISIIALLPNLLASLSVLGFMGVCGIPLDIMTITIVAISMGIAVDNTIHYIHRFRREFEKQGQYLPVMYFCHRTIGLALFYIAVTIIVGFSILTASNFIPTVLFGVFTSLAILIAVTASLTLLPRLIMLVRPFGKENKE